MYTLPKKGLDSALSAHTCSWSENSAAFCFDTITGSIQAFASPAAAACGSSVRDTAMASNPLNDCSERSELKFEVRLAKYSREPLAQENLPSWPCRGPKAADGSPSETRPFSKYLGSVPMGPTCGVHGAGPRQSRADQPV